MERLVTIPIESVMNGIPKRVSMRSISLFGLSQITLVFEDDANNATIRNLASQLLGTVTLPAGAQASLSPDATPIGEIYRYTLRAQPGFLPEELRAVEDWICEKKMRSVPGVVDLNPFGGLTKQYQVLVDPAETQSPRDQSSGGVHRVAEWQQQRGRRLRGARHGTLRGAGPRAGGQRRRYREHRRGHRQRHACLYARYRTGGHRSCHEAGPGGKTESSDGKVTRDQDDIPEAIVVMLRGENPLNVCGRIEAMADKINKQYLPPGVKLVEYYDRTGLTERTLHTVRHNMFEGIALVLLVLVLFLGLGNWRSALIVALAVPVSLLGAFLLLDLQNIPANLISMGAIDFGIIVDSAVVVIENLLRIMHRDEGKPRNLASMIHEAVLQMGRPILFSKVILLTAFIPLYTMQRVEGRIFRPMAMTLTFALITGTIFALVVVPAMASFALTRKNVAGEESWIVRLLLGIYRPALSFALRSPFLVFVAALLLLAAGGVTFTHLGSEFLPKLDEGELWVRTFAPQSISPSESAKITRNVRKRLCSFPEVRYAVSQLGRPDDGSDVNGWDVTEYSVGLKPREQWTTAHNRDDLCNAMAQNLREIPGIQTQFSQYIEDNVNEAVSGVKSELAIKLYGDDPEKLQKYADQIVGIVKNVAGPTMSAPISCWASHKSKSRWIARRSDATALRCRMCRTSSAPRWVARRQRRYSRGIARLIWW